MLPNFHPFCTGPESAGAVSARALQQALLIFLHSLSPGVLFNIVGLGSGALADRLWPASQPYSDASLAEATDHVDRLLGPAYRDAGLACNPHFDLGRALRAVFDHRQGQLDVLLLTEHALPADVMGLARAPLPGHEAGSRPPGPGVPPPLPQAPAHPLALPTARARLFPLPLSTTTPLATLTALAVAGHGACPAPPSAAHDLPALLCRQLSLTRQPSIANVRLQWSPTAGPGAFSPTLPIPSPVPSPLLTPTAPVLVGALPPLGAAVTTVPTVAYTSPGPVDEERCRELPQCPPPPSRPPMPCHTALLTRAAVRALTLSQAHAAWEVRQRVAALAVQHRVASPLTDAVVVGPGGGIVGAVQARRTAPPKAPRYTASPIGPPDAVPAAAPPLDRPPPPPAPRRTSTAPEGPSKPQPAAPRVWWRRRLPMVRRSEPQLVTGAEVDLYSAAERKAEAAAPVEAPVAGAPDTPEAPPVVVDEAPAGAGPTAPEEGLPGGGAATDDQREGGAAAPEDVPLPPSPAPAPSQPRETVAESTEAPENGAQTMDRGCEGEAAAGHAAGGGAGGGEQLPPATAAVPMAATAAAGAAAAVVAAGELPPEPDAAEGPAPASTVAAETVVAPAGPRGGVEPAAEAASQAAPAPATASPVAAETVVAPPAPRPDPEALARAAEAADQGPSGSAPTSTVAAETVVAPAGPRPDPGAVGPAAEAAGQGPPDDTLATGAADHAPVHHSGWTLFHWPFAKPPSDRRRQLQTRSSHHGVMPKPPSDTPLAPTPGPHAAEPVAPSPQVAASEAQLQAIEYPAPVELAETVKSSSSGSPGHAPTVAVPVEGAVETVEAGPSGSPERSPSSSWDVVEDGRTDGRTNSRTNGQLVQGVVNRAPGLAQEEGGDAAEARHTKEEQVAVAGSSGGTPDAHGLGHAPEEPEPVALPRADPAATLTAVLNVIRHQGAEGSWKRFPQSLCALQRLPIPEGYSCKSWRTALVVAALRMRYAECRGAWQLLVDKACDWMESEVHNADEVHQMAVEALLLVQAPV